MQYHTLKDRRFQWIALAASVITCSLIGGGCQDNAPKGAAPTTMASAKRGGAQLWADTCMRCHSLRPPTQFSNNEWQIIVHHMRVRADLTGEEEREILSFIQSANMH